MLHRFRFLVAFFLLAGGVLAAFRPAISEEKKKVGVFDRDSVQASMPAYKQALDSTAVYQALLDSQLQQMRDELMRKKELMRTDSMNWSPLVRELRKREAEDLAANIEAFREAAKDDLAKVSEQNLTAVSTRITITAAYIAKQEKLDRVVDKQELRGYLVMFPNSTVVDVTADMIEEVSKK